MAFVLQNPKVNHKDSKNWKIKSHNFNELTVLYNGYGKKQFLYLSVLLGSASMTKDHFLLKILFLGRSGVTDPYWNQI
jgi:hypothetical protein